MLYKVTPMMPEPAAKPKVVRIPGQPRKKRKTAIYDGEGNEVLITLMCLKCKKMKPLMQFGLRKMADGAIRNQPWCRGCRSGAGTPKDRRAAAVAADVARLESAAVGEDAAEPISAETTLPDAPKAITEEAPPPAQALAPAEDKPVAEGLPYALEPVS
jgi:hypothetical protein